MATDHPLPGPAIDAHHHFWDLGHCNYPWLMQKGVKRFFGDPTPIQKNYLPLDLRADALPIQLETSVHVQVGTDPADSVKETLWLQSVADDGAQLPGAIVAFADLRRGDIEDVLAAHAAVPRFRGVRQIVGRHPVEDAKHGTDALIEDPNWRMGLRVLRDTDLSFDLQLIAAQYDRMASLMERLPGLRVAICHFGSPWDLSADRFQYWRTAMQRFANLPDVYIKLSGFGMFKPDWTVEDIRPFVDSTIELFGAGRCMVGSNFPVDKLYGGYDRIWRAVAEISSDLSATERSDLFSETARRFYRL